MWQHYEAYIAIAQIDGALALENGEVFGAQLPDKVHAANASATPASTTARTRAFWNTGTVAIYQIH